MGDWRKVGTRLINFDQVVEVKLEKRWRGEEKPCIVLVTTLVGGLGGDMQPHEIELFDEQEFNDVASMRLFSKGVNRAVFDS